GAWNAPTSDLRSPTSSREREALARRSPRRVARRRVQEDQVLHQRERRLRRARPARTADAHLVVLADHSGGRDGGAALRRRRPARRRRRARLRDAARGAAAADVRRPRRRDVDRRRITRAAFAPRPRSYGGPRTSGTSSRAKDFHLRQLSRRHRLQPAAVRDARPAARAHARADRDVPVRLGVPVVRRAGREHRPAREDRRDRDPRPTADGGGRVVDLTSRLRSIVRPQNAPVRELTYEPDTGRYEASIDLDRVADVLGGRVVTNHFGRALIIDRRYESDRYHGTRRVGECELPDGDTLRLLDPSLPVPDGSGSRTLFIDLETTGLSGGAGTVAFLVGCGWFDMGAFQVRQFLLTSYASERALLCAVAECFSATSLLVTYNGKTFDVPVMETRWQFHRMPLPLESVRHFDMLHPAARLKASRWDQARGMERPATPTRNGASVSKRKTGTAQ